MSAAIPQMSALSVSHLRFNRGQVSNGYTKGGGVFETGFGKTENQLPTEVASVYLAQGQVASYAGGPVEQSCLAPKIYCQEGVSNGFLFQLFYSWAYFCKM